MNFFLNKMQTSYKHYLFSLKADSTDSGSQVFVTDGVSGFFDET